MFALLGLVSIFCVAKIKCLFKIVVYTLKNLSHLSNKKSTNKNVECKNKSNLTKKKKMNSNCCSVVYAVCLSI